MDKVRIPSFLEKFVHGKLGIYQAFDSSYSIGGDNDKYSYKLNGG